MKWQNQAVFPLLIINAITGGFTGLFVYSPSIGANNLIASIAPTGGTDPFGNTYLPNVAGYNNAAGDATSFGSGSLTFARGTLAAGWTVGSTMNDDGAGGITCSIGARTFNVSGGGLFQINGTEAIIGGSVLPMLKVTNTFSTPASPPTQLVANAAADRVLGIEVTGDTAFRYRVDSNGRTDIGNGTVTDVHTLRAAAGVYAINGTPGNLVIGADAETTTATLEVQGFMAMGTHAAPATPPAGFADLYINSGDLLAHLKSAAGADATLSVGSGDNTPVTVTAAVATRISRNWNIAANEVNSAGQTYRLTVWGNGTQGSTAQTLTWSVWLDGVAVQSVTATALPINAPFRWKVEILLSIATVGGSGNGSVNLEGVWSSTASPTVENSFCAGSASATGQSFSTLILHTLALAVAWASTTGAPTITCIGSTFERIGP